MSARYTVGIDLGTSHTVVAYAPLAAAAGQTAIELLPIPQLVGPGEVADSALLPSVRYHPAPGELSAAQLQLPWPAPPDAQEPPDAPPAVLGRYAQALGAQVPGRLVASAKSWLSHAGVDRTAAILPWGAGDGVATVSPVQASASYLAHVRAAWNVRFADAPLEQQDIVLTVPASFDEGARALTLEAARRAGLPTLRLLEEPQAAFHDWLFRHRASLAAELEGARLVLVCDVGGGTTDLTLIQVEPGPQGLPQLTRIGVGEHLMLGGDNMDMALARLVEQRLGASAPLPAARFAQLVQRCRLAKEQLLAPQAPDHATITLLGAGARLIGSAASATVTRTEVERLVVDGFLPEEGADVRPQRRRTGLVEWGLPYPADAAITRHVAEFLARHASAPDAVALPDTLLLNGGVFRAPALAQRLEHTLVRWRGAPVRLLHNDAPDVAVARGAVAYALVRAARVPELGHGIGGGAARSYFLVLEGHSGPPRGICVLPRGTQEGVVVALREHTFALRLGQAVRFHLVSSLATTPWQAGDLVDLPDLEGAGAAGDARADAFARLPPLQTVLPLPPGQQRKDVRVQLTATMTEVGTLEMHCTRTEDAQQRWLLAFQLRTDADTAAQPPATPVSHPRLPDAVALIEHIFGSSAHKPDAKEVRQLRSRLERVLGRREEIGRAHV